ncbi:MAG: hypothetical protein LBV78_23070, partial [Kitasatospora sp.]|nr:hypothetical protein [Kitasatospora sp.]
MDEQRTGRPASGVPLPHVRTAVARLRRRWHSPAGPPTVATGLALVAVCELLVRAPGLHTYLPVA